MSEMRTQNTTGRKTRRIAAVALILALILSVGAAVISASAANGNGLFKIEVLNNIEGTDAKATPNSSQTAVDGKSNFSNDVSVNLKTDKIFTTEYVNMSKVTRLELILSEQSTGVVKVAVSGSWKGYGTESSPYYYYNKNGIDKGTFDTLMNSVTVSCNKSSTTANASVKLTLKGGNTGSNSNTKISNNVLTGNQLGLASGKATTYTEVINFFTYASGAVDESSVKVQIENNEDDDVNEHPDPSGTVTALFDMTVTNVGNSSFLRLGYQVKEASQTWDANTQVLHGIDEDLYRFEKSDYDQLGNVSSSTGAVTNQKPITIKVPGLDPEKEYDIRGVVVTNSDSAAYTKAVTVPRVKYTQPVVASLNIGNTAPQESGTKKDISATIEFNNHNYDNDGSGPRLKMELWFTQNRTTTEEGKDASDWGKEPVETRTAYLRNDDGSYKTSYEFTAEHTLPDGDSANCAYKLVVTDVKANGNPEDSEGYFITKYSDYQFILDQSPPSAPKVTAVGLADDANLGDGTAVVGGANSKVELRITGSTDNGSGVKEYSYEMYYLGTDNVTQFQDAKGLLRTSSNAEILKKMAELSGADSMNLYEYTSPTSLELKADDSDRDNEAKKYSVLNISKDGFYCIHAKAVDNVGKSSVATIAIFRVDLTPPTEPVIRLVQQKDSGKNISLSGGALTASDFEPYDDRTYSDATVWVLARTDAQAGKSINPAAYEFSINGGLTWRKITTAKNFSGGAAYSTVKGSLQVYQNGNYTTPVSFSYDAAFELSCDEISGYQTVIVRATDTMGNTSLPSDGASMRTTANIVPIANIKHEGIEIAMALGNTTLETTASIVPDLRNDVALKINEKYFGTNHSYGDKTNPISALYVKAGEIHQCKFTKASNACDDGANCPYTKDAQLYTPSMVNMQDLDSGEDEADTNFDWVRFDHTNYVSETVSGKGTVYYPTVVFDAGEVATSNPTDGPARPALHTTADTNIDKTKSTYQTSSGQTRYTAMTDYVVYTGQTEAITNASRTAGASYRDANVKLLTPSTTGTTLTGTNSNTFSGKYNTSTSTLLGEDTYTQMGRYAAYSGHTDGTSNVSKRVYHIVDMTKTSTLPSIPSDVEGANPFTNVKVSSLADQGQWSTIYTLGYNRSSSRDWIFAYNGQSTRKEIFFSTDSSQIGPHSNDGYGFLFNTTIRQNTSGEWVISGYLFGLGTLATNQAATAYQKFIFYLEDVRLDWFANSRIVSQGQFDDVDKGDVFASIAVDLTNGNNTKTAGTYTANADGSRTLTFGTQKITLLAREAADTGNYKNYCFVTDGASAELYIWISSTAQTQKQVVDQFDNGSGFNRISWKQADGSTAYKNNNPSASAPGKNADASYVLYVPRPKVDNTSVGDLSKFEDTDDPTKSPHSDSNCYGFGPISFARSNGHGCARDSLVVFSNVTLRVTKGLSLSDVITQPRWGTGKVKYILNVSDDSIADLTDPIMSANVAWRIQTDSAKFISWGSLINRKVTQNFIDTRIEGNGKYVVSRVTSYDDDASIQTAAKTAAPGQRTQSKQVAEYIADTYYKSYGLNMDTAGNVPDKVNELVKKKGQVISLENAKLMSFSVEPAEYNSGTANEDFPSGRWYIAYDGTGYDRSSYARYSDALDVSLNKPGRYQIYFAPDKSLLGADLKNPLDDQLDPDGKNCIFDVVVNEEAYAQPIASLGSDGKTITISDFSYDPDNSRLITDAQDYYPEKTPSGQQLTGIIKTYWRWEMTAPYVDPDSKEQSSIVLMQSTGTEQKNGKSWTPATRDTSGNITSPYNGKTVEALTKAVGKLYTDTASGYNAQDYVNKNTNLKPSGSSGSYYYAQVPDGATITIYEMVEDVSTRRVYKSGQRGYQEAGRTLSKESSANLISDASQAKPIRPASSITLSNETVYDTADDSDYLTVTRNSFHGQKKTLALSWEVDLPNYSDPVPLTSTDGGKTWSTPANNTVLNSQTNAKWTGGQYTVLENVTVPGFDSATGRTSGQWKISKATIKKLLSSAYGNFSLRVIETVEKTTGNTWNTTKTNAWPDGTIDDITDNSSRTIYYARDEKAPTLQTVTLETGTRKADGTGYEDAKFDWVDYEASSYLDMTTAIGKAGEKVIKVSVSGSTDSEGHVAGYAYTFYDYAAGSTDLTKATYYYMDSEGKLHKAANGVKDAIQRSLGKNGRGILTNDNQVVSEDEEFSFIINANAMYLDGTMRLPTASLNLGIFAYDNQTGNTTPSAGAAIAITGANETSRTKVENIKLAQFTPTPLAITAVNTTGETISKIGNDEALKGGTDVQVTEINVVNTKVTVSFTPRQDWFPVGKTASTDRVTDAKLIEQLESAPNDNYVKYFTDKSGAADLTNKVTVDYKVERKAPGASNYVVIADGEKKDQPYTTNVSLSDGGDYRVTAKAKNGSGVYSEERVLTFSIDRTPPSPKPSVTVFDDQNQQYKVGEWVKSARVSMTGSADEDPLAYYMYSIDNGATWKDTKSTGTYLGLYSFNITETGTHYVRVKAVDSGGNEIEADTIKVMVDATPPKTAAPTMLATSQSVTVFEECIISISQTVGGVVYSLDDKGEVNKADQQVIVKPGDPASFVIVPDAGKRVFDIKIGDTAYSTETLTAHGQVDGKDAWLLTVPQVNDDGVLKVVFEDAAAAANYMANARVASNNALVALRAALPEVYASNDAPIAIAATDIHHVMVRNANLSVLDYEINPEDVLDGEDAVLRITMLDQSYRVKELQITKNGKETTVPEEELTKKDGYYEYLIEGVTSDVIIDIVVDEKKPATVTLDVDGNGSIKINGVKVANDEYVYQTYIGEQLKLEIEPINSDYKLSSLKVDGVEKVVGAAQDEYMIEVTTANMKLEAKFEVDATDPDDMSFLQVVFNWVEGGIHGTLSPRGTVTGGVDGPETHLIAVPYKKDQPQSQTLIFKPEYGYEPTVESYKSLGQMHSGLTPVKDEKTGYYTLTLNDLQGEEGDHVLTVSFVSKQYTITTSTTAKEDGYDDVAGAGGMITLKVNGKALETNKVQEGANVTVEITPDTGYKIEEVKVDGAKVGQVNTLTLNEVSKDYKIDATFRKRNFGSAKTTHAMTVTAVGVSDGQEALNDQPYAFRLDNGSFSAFQAGTSYTYPNLLPNHQYTVTVMARDRRDNRSPETATFVDTETATGVVYANAARAYTLANMPAALSVAEADDTDNVNDKTVKVGVDPMGNPADTEYCIYYSEYANMRYRYLATVQPKTAQLENEDDKYWSTLDGVGQITVYGLAPGTKYYLQVVARNHDKIPTEANDQNILEITLSPTAPPDNTLYFEEQKTPGGDIVLHWDDPVGEVSGFLLYRDGTMIAALDEEARSWSDNYSNLRGDGAFVYSYAYINSAGNGSRRTAVSEEYYKKAKAVTDAETAENPNQGTIDAAKAELKKLDDLMQNDTYPNLYKEAMTYPVFPSYFTKVYAMPVSTNEYSGEMVLRILPESASAARAQKYIVGLHAYQNGQLIPYGTKYDGNTKTWEKQEQSTVCTSSSGATVTWKDLNINWDYKVYVKEVSSTGATVKDPNNGNVTDGYQSGTSITPETALGKRYIVDYQGYSFEYGAGKNPNGVLNVPAKTMWANAPITSDEYTKRANDSYVGWSNNNGEGIELKSSTAVTADDSYIKFNKSPQIFLPKSGSSYDLDFLYGTAKNDNKELTAYNNRYLVVEQGDNGMVVKLHVKVYDPDGPADGNLNYTVTGTLGGVTARTTIAPTAVDIPAVGADEAHATECVLEFDLKNLATGVYGDLKLSVANGSIDVAYDDKDNVLAKSVNVVVNQSLPTINASNGGGTKKLEDGRNYGEYITNPDAPNKSTVIVTTSVSANVPKDLYKVRMILMEDLYKKAEQAKTITDLNGLFSRVMEEKATPADETAIKSVAPPMISYFQVTKENYDKAKELSEVKANPSLAISTEPVAGTIYYWVEKDIALKNNWCQFLTRDASNQYTVKLHADDPNRNDAVGTTYPVYLVANFGGNESTMNLRFQVMSKPSLTVETEQTWKWLQTTEAEYTAYQEKAENNENLSGKWTIGDVYQEAQNANALNDNSMSPENLGYDLTDPAMKIENEGEPNASYWVFKLWDNKATIQAKEVSGYLQVKTGMYSNIVRAQVVMVPGVKTDPNGAHDAPPAAGSKPAGYTGDAVIRSATASYQLGDTLYDNTRASFHVDGLEHDTTYYMWVYYLVVDPETKAEVWYHDGQEAIAMTTAGDYNVSTIGFDETRASYEEKTFTLTGRPDSAMLTRLGDYRLSGVKVQITAEYYEADQYGEYLYKDEFGNPIPIDHNSNQYAWAKETVELLDQELTLQAEEKQIGVRYHIKNTDKQQGHLIVRLNLKVIENIGSGAINRETTNADVFEIFLLDDESPVTTYIPGLDDQDGLILTGAGGDDHKNTQHYDYQFGGLPDPYGTADMSSLSLSIKNVGTGELNHITATLWNKDRTKKADDVDATDINFVFATPLTSTALASPEEGDLAKSERSLLRIVPKEGLPDGIHEGWLEISADFANENEHPENVVWVHLYQVVGQATLKGNIYIGESKPETTSEFVGYATVKVYSAAAPTGSNHGTPLYETQTDSNGYYEIPNILKNEAYCIVIERIGCATYDGVNKRSMWVPEESANYRLDLRMVAGDIDGNGRVDTDDRTLLEKYMNHTLAEAEATGQTDLIEWIRKCDLDQNGGVNSIDRMLLWNNLNRGATVGGITIQLYATVLPEKMNQ